MRFKALARTSPAGFTLLSGLGGKDIWGFKAQSAGKFQKFKVARISFSKAF